LQLKKNSANWHGYRIMLVDDEPDITLSFNMILEDNGFNVDAYNDPLLALSSFKAGLYAMAILDIRMPKMNGYELSGEIRKIDDKVKISFMSAFDILEDNLKSAVPTLNEEKPLIIKKPISLDDFVSRVKSKLE
jgi:two-component system, OmpR family, response regulator ChvI